MPYHGFQAIPILGGANMLRYGYDSDMGKWVLFLDDIILTAKDTEQEILVEYKKYKEKFEIKY
jgi:hypothetical protein